MSQAVHTRITETAQGQQEPVPAGSRARQKHPNKRTGESLQRGEWAVSAKNGSEHPQQGACTVCLTR
jgi:glucan-binding YG repeat protein